MFLMNPISKVETLQIQGSRTTRPGQATHSTRPLQPQRGHSQLSGILRGSALKSFRPAWLWTRPFTPIIASSSRAIWPCLFDKDKVIELQRGGSFVWFSTRLGSRMPGSRLSCDTGAKSVIYGLVWHGLVWLLVEPYPALV